MSKIRENLSQIFEKHRIIFWYDEEGQYRDELDALAPEGVIVLRLEGNSFALKYEMLIRHPEAKFLVYSAAKQEPIGTNWLIDLELDQYVFHTDQEALVLQELSLPQHLRPWVGRHLAFFRSKERLKRFMGLAAADDDEHKLTCKLCQLVLRAEQAAPADLLRAWASAHINDKAEPLEKEMELFGLSKPFWQEMERVYGYKSADPGIWDFLIALFRQNFRPMASHKLMGSGGEVLFSLWQDSASFADDFQKISTRIAEKLHIAQRVHDYSLEDLIDEDAFELTDSWVIAALADHILKGTTSLDKIHLLIKRREGKYWYKKYSAYYEALHYAALLQNSVSRFDLQAPSSLEEGIDQYVQRWHKVDQYYRKFLYFYHDAHQNSVLNELYGLIHRIYSNDWLPALSLRWQEALDREGSWYGGEKKQASFYSLDVKPYIEKQTKVFVVISDALRYECGEELHRRIKEENRFSSRLDYRVSNLPSYTQLGMASLLPHTSLAFGEGDDILADGKSTMGLAPRNKVLNSNPGVRGKAISAEDLMKLPSRGKEAQQLIQDNDLVYVYHNRIDKVGDEKISEGKVMEAVEEELEFLLELAKKIANMNGNHILFTSDHGFLYQNEAIEETDFLGTGHSGDIIKTNRRFVLGRDMKPGSGSMVFKARDLGIESDLDVLIPKGIQRLRVQGAGSRFVHGGASLQETLVPILFVAKKRKDTLRPVGVDILNKMSNRITTHIQSVRFFQQEAVGEGLSERSIKAYFAVQSDEGYRKISNVYYYTFNSTAPEPEKREVKANFNITSEIQQNKEVYLVIEQKLPGTSQYEEIHKFSYILTIAMDRDFDDF